MDRNTARVEADGEESLLANILKLIYENRSTEYDLFDFISKIHNILKKEKVIKITHIGEDHLGLGDIKCECEGKVIYIETKFGKDTLANIGENSLTDKGLFFEAISWSQFRNQAGFDQKIIELLSPHNKSNVDLNSRSERADFVRTLKTLLGVKKNTEPVLKNIIKNNLENKNIATTLMTIIELANNNKQKYVSYLSTQPFDKSKLKDFFNSISSGITPKKHAITDLVYEYYYITPTEIKKITKEDLEKVKSEDFSISFGEHHVEMSNGIETIRVVFHWKNVMQGIQTPCLNLFRK